jgi:hypothetical protein
MRISFNFFLNIIIEICKMYGFNCSQKSFISKGKQETLHFVKMFENNN